MAEVSIIGAMTTTTFPRSADAIRPVGPGVPCHGDFRRCDDFAIVVCEVEAELLASYLCHKHAKEYYGD